MTERDYFFNKLYVLMKKIENFCTYISYEIMTSDSLI